jgi:hypothetical protein
MFDFSLNKFLKLKLNKVNELVGRIYNLEKKLNGEIPVNKLELIKLINSWGRNNSGSIPIKDNENNEVELHAGETVLLPASTMDITIIPEGSAKLLETYV